MSVLFISLWWKDLYNLQSDTLLRQDSEFLKKNPLVNELYTKPSLFEYLHPKLLNDLAIYSILPCLSVPLVC